MKPTKYKTVDELDYSFSIQDLSDLVLLKVSGKKKVGSNNAVHHVTEWFLREYGINLWGQTHIQAEPGSEWRINVRAASITKDFPIENERLLRQLYPWKGVIDIGLPSGGANCAYSFGYDTNTYKCKLIKHVYGSQEWTRDFESLNELLSALRHVSDIEDLAP